jgi:tetratricopeptide (TPR) repeat protein
MSAADSPSRSWTATAAFAVVVLGVVAYANSLSGAFLLDDGASISQNESIRRLDDLRAVLTEMPASTSARPVVNLSFALNYAAGGTDVLGYHLVNGAVHLLAALALFGVVRRTLELVPRLAEASTPLAFAVAALWTVHPLQTESVTYVCQRAESLAGLFLLTTLYCAIRAATTAPPNRCWAAASVAACALGMATKETMVAAPLLVLLHDRTFVAGSFREAWRKRRALHLGLAATWIVLAALMASSKGRGESAGFGYGMSAWEYARTQPGVIVDYLRLCFWPHPLLLDRGARVATAAEIAPYAVVVAALLAATAWALARRPALGFVGAWFFVVLAPTSSFVPLVTQTAAEHRMYLALAAVATLAVVAVHAAAPRAGVVLLAAALLALTWRTHERNALYESPRAMWADAVAQDPDNVRARMNLGMALALQGDVGAGIEQLDVAVGLDPGNAYARLLRGNLLHKAGESEAALADYVEAEKSPRRAAAALVSRAVVYLERGEIDFAMRAVNAAIRRAPENAAAYVARANAHMAREDFEAAWADVRTARRLGRPPSAAFIERLTEESGRTE